MVHCISIDCHRVAIIKHIYKQNRAFSALLQVSLKHKACPRKQAKRMYMVNPRKVQPGYETKSMEVLKVPPALGSSFFLIWTSRNER